MAVADRFDWHVRLDDPNEALFTLAVVSDLFGVDPQVIRRMDQAGVCAARRTDGNHRRYSRNDVEAIGQAFSMRRDGVAHNAMVQIIALQHQVAALRAEIARLGEADT